MLKLTGESIANFLDSSASIIGRIEPYKINLKNNMTHF